MQEYLQSQKSQTSSDQPERGKATMSKNYTSTGTS